MPPVEPASAVGVAGEPGRGNATFASAAPESMGPYAGNAVGQSPADVIRLLRGQLAAGAPWHLALLQAMGRWMPSEETLHGRRYKYVIGREAFDWLLLAERLCAEVSHLLPSRDVERLLFRGELPEPVEEDELRELLGVSKYRAYLNFHYGVVLEEALQLAVEESVRKRHFARGFSDSEELVEDVFRHLYVRSRTELLSEFRAKAKLGKRQGFTLHDIKEFTYWLHKGRVNYWDPARVASDTRLAIRRLEALREAAASFALSR